MMKAETTTARSQGYHNKPSKRLNSRKYEREETTTLSSLPLPQHRQQQQRKQRKQRQRGEQRRRKPINKASRKPFIDYDLDQGIKGKMIFSAPWLTGQSGHPAASPAAAATRSGPGSTSCPSSPTGTACQVRSLTLNAPGQGL